MRPVPNQRGCLAKPQLLCTILIQLAASRCGWPSPMHGDNTEQRMNLSNYQVCSVSEVFVWDFYISVCVYTYYIYIQYVCVCVHLQSRATSLPEVSSFFHAWHSSQDTWSGFGLADPTWFFKSLSGIQDDSSLCMPLKAAYSVQHSSTVSCIVWPYGVQRAPEFWWPWAWSSEDLDADSNARRRRLLRTRSTLRYCWLHYAHTSNPSMSLYVLIWKNTVNGKPICDVTKIA